MNGEVTFKDGVGARIVHLDQHLVYANVLEGIPNHRINRGIVADAVRDAEKRWPETPCHLMEPSERAPHPTRPSASFLPAVICSAVLRRDGTTSTDEPCWETLVVIWFQDEYALPIATAVLDQLRTLDWKSLAVQELT